MNHEGKSVVPPLPGEILATAHEFCGEIVYVPDPSTGLKRHESRLLRKVLVDGQAEVTHFLGHVAVCNVNKHLLAWKKNSRGRMVVYRLGQEPRDLHRKRKAKPRKLSARKQKQMANLWKRRALTSKGEERKKAWAAYYKVATVKVAEPLLSKEQREQLRAMASSMGSKKAHLSKARAEMKRLHFSGKKHTDEYRKAAADVAKWRPLYELAYGQYLHLKEQFTKAAGTGTFGDGTNRQGSAKCEGVS